MASHPATREFHWGTEQGRPIKVTVLGAGTALPWPERSAPGHLVQFGNTALLFDIGPGTVARLAQAGVGYSDVEYVFVTHLHPDHVLDLAALIQANSCTPGWMREKALHLAGCQGLAAFYQGLLALFPDIAPQTYGVNVRELGTERIAYAHWTIETCLTGHTATSLAYRLEANGRAIVFSGDATLSPALIHLARQADLLVCECSFPGDDGGPDHLAARQVGRLALEAGAKRLAVVHLYPVALQADVLSVIGEEYVGPIWIAHDGATWVI
ncbi:MAG: MBL fold metallo-hydrolase [Anaerolineae bacterium]